MNIFVSVPPAPKSYQEYVMDKDDTYTQSGLHYTREIQDQGVRLLEQAANKPVSLPLSADGDMTVVIWSP